MRPAPVLLRLALSLFVAGTFGCGGETPVDPEPTGTVNVTLLSSAVSVNVGGSAVVNLGISRGGGFTGAVALTVTGLPAGVTGAFVPASLDASTTASVLTLTAAAGAVAGTTTATVSASGSGVTTATAQLQVTVVQPTIALALTPATLTLAAGQNSVISVAVTRSAGYTGAVTLSLSAPPAGITAAFNVSPTLAATSAMTLTVAGSVVPGAYTITVKGTGPNVADKTATLALTVIAAAPVGFSVSVDPAEFELPAGRGWGSQGIVSVQRLNGFAGPVSVSVQGLSFPAAVGVTPATIAAGGKGANLLAIAVDNAAPGVYTGTVKVSAPGFADQTAPVRFRVSLPSTGSLSWNFCTRVPQYFAIRDGNGPWQHIVPSGPAAGGAADPARYAFNLTQATGSVALVWLGEKTSASPLIEGHHWNVYYLSRQEIIDLAAEECITNRAVTSRTASGPVTGYLSFDAIVASAGRRGLAGVGSTGPLNTTLSMQNLPFGPFDLMLSRTNFSTGGPDIGVQSVVLRRGIDPANGATIPAIDFATEGFAPASATLNFANTNGENFFNSLTFRTLDGLYGWMSAAGGFSITSRIWYGIPTNRMIAGDLHQITATTTNAAARREIIHFSREVGSRTLTFGPPLSTPAVTPVTATPWILRAAGTLAADYASRVAVFYREDFADPRTMVIVASRAFLGGTTQYDVPIPDLAGTTAFMAFWNIRRGSPVKWTVTGGQGCVSDPLSDSFCIFNGYTPVRPIDGATYLSAQATGTVTIP